MATSLSKLLLRVCLFAGFAAGAGSDLAAIATYMIWCSASRA